MSCARCSPPTACRCCSRAAAATSSRSRTRGGAALAAGVIEATVARMGVPAAELIAWLGPAIGPRVYEVGEEVRDAFVRPSPAAAVAFAPSAARQVPGRPSRACARAALTRGLGRDLAAAITALSAIASGSSRIGATRRAVASRASSGAIDRHPMGTLGYIVAASLVGGLLSSSARHSLAHAARALGDDARQLRDRRAARRGISRGHPARLRQRRGPRAVSATVLGGILAFFVLEKLLLWRHFHGDEWRRARSSHRRLGPRAERTDDPGRRQRSTISSTAC